MSHSTLHEVVLAADIPARLIEDISHAKESVHLQSMNFETTHQMSNVIDACLAAIERGVKVTFAFDLIATTGWRGGLLRNSVVPLRSAGITINLLGKPLFPLKVAGRSHTKVYLVDDMSYFGGGVNLYEPSFGYHDFMLRSVGNAPLLKTLHELIERQPIDSTDWREQLGSDQILVDGGTRGSSLIFDEAAKLAMSAKRAWYVSQFSPGYKLEKALRCLPRESYKAWFNSVVSSDIRDKWSALIDSKVSRLDNRYKGTRRIHAKFLVVQKVDGSCSAITGSHNFSDWGVRFGTKEAALYTTDQALCYLLIKFAESLDE